MAKNSKIRELILYVLLQDYLKKVDEAYEKETEEIVKSLKTDHEKSKIIELDEKLNKIEAKMLTEHLVGLIAKAKHLERVKTKDGGGQSRSKNLKTVKNTIYNAIESLQRDGAINKERNTENKSSPSFLRLTEKGLTKAFTISATHEDFALIYYYYRSKNKKMDHYQQEQTDPNKAFSLRTS